MMFIVIYSCIQLPEKMVSVDSAVALNDESPDSGELTNTNDSAELETQVDFSIGIYTDSTISNSLLPLNIDIWYPSEDNSGALHTYGWPGFEFSGAAQEGLSAACSEPRPVIVHSHGNASLRWELYQLHESLAGEGYIVVAPDHSGNTFYANTSPTPILTVQRPQDVKDTFDWLVLESSDPNSLMHGCVDASAGYIVSGYSFGGYTAYVTAGALVNDALGEPSILQNDERVQAVLVYAPWTAFILDEGVSNITVPVLSLGSNRDLTVEEDEATLFSHVQSLPRASGRFPDGGHFTFTPQYCSVLPENNGCGDDNIDPELAMSHITESTIIFLEHLKSGVSLDAVQSSELFEWQFW